MQLARNFAGGFQIVGLQRAVDIHRMAGIAIAAGDAGDARRQRFHGAERRIVGHGLRRERPGVAHGHRAEAARDAPALVRTWQSTFSSVTRSTVCAPKRYGRAVAEILVGEADCHRWRCGPARTRRGRCRMRRGRKQTNGGMRAGSCAILPWYPVRQRDARSADDMVRAGAGALQSALRGAVRGCRFHERAALSLAAIAARGA